MSLSGKGTAYCTWATALVGCSCKPDDGYSLDACARGDRGRTKNRKPRRQHHDIGHPAKTTKKQTLCEQVCVFACLTSATWPRRTSILREAALILSVLVRHGRDERVVCARMKRTSQDPRHESRVTPLPKSAETSAKRQRPGMLWLQSARISSRRALLVAPLVEPTAMKFSPNVSSSRRKCRKAHFSAPSNERRKMMAAPLSSELKNKYGVRHLPSSCAVLLSLAGFSLRNRRRQPS